jgi:putative hydrolase of the HAD superfamily
MIIAELKKHKPLPGITETINLAYENGLKLAVASSSSAWWVKGFLKHLKLAHFFEAVSTKEEVTKVKPDPALYLLTLHKLKLKADECLVIEDSVNGVKAAAAAGIKTIAVPCGLTRHMDFTEASKVYSSLLDFNLKDWL